MKTLQKTKLITIKIDAVLENGIEDEKVILQDYDCVILDCSTEQLPMLHSLTGTKENLKKYLTSKLYGENMEFVLETWKELQ